MIGWLIYKKVDAEQNKSYINWFIEEAKQQDVELKLVYREDLTIGIVEQNPVVYMNNLKQILPDFIINRSIEPLIQQFFNSFTIPIFNGAETAKIVNNKANTHLEISNLNIPMLPTYFIHGGALPKDIPIGFPAVIKSVAGRGGEEVYFIESEQDWHDIQQQCSTQEYIIQPTNVQLGKDVRVFIIGTEIIAAVLRHNEQDFRANFKLGGKAFPYNLSDSDIKMIERIIHHFDFGLVGIDFLIDHNDHLIFNEIEDVVGSRILSETSDINLLEKYMTFIKDIVERKKEVT